MAPRLSNRDIAFLVGGVSAGGSIGSLLGYKKGKLKFEKLADQEIAAMRETFRQKTELAEAQAVATASVTEKPSLEDMVTQHGYKPPPGVTIEAEPEDPTAIETTVVNVNVFEMSESTQAWDYARESRLRRENDGRPFVIHKDEYDQGAFHEEEPFEQNTLTYFVGDDVLCDESDIPVDERDELVGLENLERFGEGSPDPSRVYVRNEKIQTDFEICRSDGKFGTEVHGFTDDELQHSAVPIRRRQRHRRDDE